MQSHTSHVMRRTVLQAQSTTGTSLNLESLDMTNFAFKLNWQQIKNGADQTGCRLIHVLVVIYAGLQTRVRA